MMRRKDDETPEREVSLWLEKNGISLQRYLRLQPWEKKVLRNRICVPTRPTSYSQLKDLYKKLCLPDIAGRESIDPVDFMPPEELEKFFTPLAPSETLSYLEKF